MKYLLLFDVGNSDVEIVVVQYDDGYHLASCRLPSDSKIDQQFLRSLDLFLTDHEITAAQLSAAAVASVKSNKGELIKSIIEDHYSLQCFILDYESCIQTDQGLGFAIEDPSSIGADLLAASIESINTWPKQATLVVDCGTATTFMITTSKHIFIGGAIIPGLKAGLHNFLQRIDLIKESSFLTPHKVIGTNTHECINSGVYYAHIGAIREIIMRMKDEYSKSHAENLEVILTGGCANLLINDLGADYIDRHCPGLVIDGLYHFCRKAIKRKDIKDQGIED